MNMLEVAIKTIIGKYGILKNRRLETHTKRS